MRLAHFTTALLIAFAVGAKSTSATVIDGVYSFTASNFTGTLTLPAVDPAVGSFGLTFDNTNSTLSLSPRDVSLNFGPIDSVSVNYISIADQLMFQASSGTTTFSLGILDASAAPALQFASFFLDTGLSATFEGAVSFAPAKTPVPEPTSMVLFSAGLAGFGLVRRCSKRASDPALQLGSSLQSFG